jgi:cytochrome c-type biogenesis protein CcmH/NrfG
MEIEDFYKIIAKLEKEQERLAKLQAEIVEKITVTNAAQNKDLATLSSNITAISRQLEKLNTSQNNTGSEKIHSGMRVLGDNTISIYKKTKLVLLLIVLILVLVGVIEWQVFHVPEKTWQWYSSEHNQANQTKRSK